MYGLFTITHDGLLCPIYEYSALVPDPILTHHRGNVNRTLLTGSMGICLP